MSLDVKIEVAFTTDPDDTPTWTDISDYVDVAAGVSITRGRADTDETTQPSAASWTLDNSDGRFTPGYADGAYYPNVILGRRVRVSLRKDSGDWQTRFDGFMASWPVQWSPTGTYAEAHVTAVDRLQRLGRQVVTETALATVIRADGPSDWWPLHDPTGTTTDPQNVTGSTRLFPSSITTDDSAIEFDGSQVKVTEWGLYGWGSPPYHVPTDIGAGGVTFEVVARWPSTAAPYDTWLIWTDQAGNDDVLSLLLGMQSSDGSAYATWSQDRSGGVGSEQVSGGFLLDGARHHIAVTFVRDFGDPLTMTLYVDGVAVDSSSVALLQSADPGFITGVLFAGGASAKNPIEVDAEHLAAYQRALTADEIAVHAWAAGVVTDESSTDRWDNLVALGDLPSGFFDTVGTAGTTAMAPLPDTTGQSFGQLFQAAADAEAGLLFVDTDGVVTLRTRREDDNQAVLVTLTAGQYNDDLTFRLDDQGLLNDVTATSGTGTVRRYSDATSITAYGTYSASIEVATLDDTMAETAGITRVVRSQPAPRCRQVTVDLLTQQSLCSTFWGSELLGALLTLSGLPDSAPSSSVDLQVQGYTETFSLDQYAITLNATPALPACWKLGNSTLGKLGSTTRITF